jgi:RNA polymerase sigma-54 factor
VLLQEQRQGISQRIDPKLIMANAILQQSSIELVQQIEAELLENPALDMIEEETPCLGDCPNPALCPYCSQRAAQQIHTHSLSDEETTNYVDGVFEADEDYDPVGNLEAELTLQEHLCTLLRAAVSEEDYPIGEYVIQSLNDSGLIDAPLEELAREIGVTLEDVCRVLSVIQTFDPPGVGAQNLL